MFHKPVVMEFYYFLNILFSRFFLGSNKVMQVALGRSAADEVRPGIYKVSKVHIFFLHMSFFCIISLLFFTTRILTSFRLFSYYSFCVETLDSVLPICQRKKLKGNCINL